ncbi:SoxR reducing system RseC family protein [Candidatus Fermentibacteria bacterium]|nr:SoxR reducing system RseC family protein [Candidatus Fermentibacteria bacterium]
MKQYGVVIESSPGEAIVALSGADGCRTCGGRDGCGILCSGMRKRRDVRVLNPLGATAGDRVEVELAPAAALALSGALFLVPVVFLVAALALSPGGGEGSGSSAWALGSLAAGLAAALALSKLLSRRKGFQMRITAVLGRADAACGGEGDDTAR